MCNRFPVRSRLSEQNHNPKQRRQSKYILGGDRGAEGGGCGKGVSPSGEGEQPPPQNFFLILDLKMAICGAFLVQFFCSSAKTLRGRKDTLAQVYFYWGQSPPSPPAPRDRRH